MKPLWDIVTSRALRRRGATTGKVALVMLSVIGGVASSRAPAAQSAAEDRYGPGREIVADIGRIVTPGGVQESLIVDLGGTRQVINVRGADRRNPLLLFVHGGPGAVEMPIAWTFQRPWEDYFTVVQWDQRGAGRSYPLNPVEAIAPTMTLERYRDDAIELIEQLRQRYGKRKVVLLGHSWGSLLGLSVAVKRPDLLHAYVGMGQIIDMRENERVGIAWTLGEARRRGHAEALASLEALASYPDRGPFTIEQADAWRRWAIGYGALAAYRKDANFYLRAPRLSPEYTAKDRQAWVDGSSFTVRTLWPRLADEGFGAVRRMRVPTFMLLGRHDYVTPSVIAERWMDRLTAPRKKVVWFEHSAHLPMLEEPGRVLETLIRHVHPMAGHRDAAGGARAMSRASSDAAKDMQP